jgi:eukaryotic-like serine/threonine-protein kinase
MITETSIAPAAGIAAGTLVGGRFLIERRMASGAIGELLFARDQKTRKPIAVWVLSQSFAGDQAVFELIRGEVRNVARLKHRSLVGTYGIGTHGEQRFIACEWVHGTSLTELALRVRADHPLSLRGMCNVIAHVCNAIGYVHAESSCHGGLRPHVVWISTAGRVKLAELGLGAALARSGKWRLLAADERACLAPEVTGAGTLSPATDVYGVGVLLFFMLTGRYPSEPLADPSRGHPEGGPELDAIVARCLAARPADRFASVAEVRAALLPRAAASVPPPPHEFGVDLHIDVDVALSIPPRARSPRPVSPRASAKQVSVAALTATATGVASSPALAVAPDDQLAALMNKLTENDAPRWMAVKNGLDHGPFTARELIKLIVEGEILEQHGLFNMRSNERKTLAEWVEFREFVEQYKLRKAEADHLAALKRSTLIERRSNLAKFAILAGLILVLVVAGGAYLVSRRAAEARRAEKEVNLAALFESGRVKVHGTAGILKTRPPRAGARRAPGTPGGSLGSYDDAMNQAMDLGDATKSGGEGQLRPSDIESVMNRQLNTLFSCVSQELRAKRRLGAVQIDLAILGSGQVMGASVNTGSPAFQSCIAGKLHQIRFPSFPAPRMGARYSFDVE